MADRIVVLHGGDISQVGAPLELYHKPQNTFVAGFIGNPRMNMLPVRCTGVSADGVVVEFQGQSVTLPVTPRAGIEGSEMLLGIRPEHVELGQGDLSLQVVPTVVEQLGQQTIGYATLAGREENFLFVLPGTRGIEDDKPITLGFAASDCHLFDDAGQALERRVDIAALTAPSL
jgi:multiple sugar transport system ATP-binding protein